MDVLKMLEICSITEKVLNIKINKKGIWRKKKINKRLK